MGGENSPISPPLDPRLHIVINARSIPSLKLIFVYISFLKYEAQKTKQFCSVFGVAIEIHGRITASGVRVFL